MFGMHSHQNKIKINWTKSKDFKKIVKDIKKETSLRLSGKVSGGKDSTWQIIKLIEYGLSPLTFTYKPLLVNKIGQKILIT